MLGLDRSWLPTDSTIADRKRGSCDVDSRALAPIYTACNIEKLGMDQATAIANFDIDGEISKKLYDYESHSEQQEWLRT